MSTGSSIPGGSAPAQPRPLPNPSTGSANPAASLPALWGYLQPALHHIVRSPTNNTTKAPAIDVSYHMGVHTAVYNYFTSQAEQPVPGPIVAGLRSPSVDKGKAPSGPDLYEQIDRFYADAAREIFLGAPADDTTLVHYLIPCYHRYSAGAQSVSRLLNYVNRHYVKRAVDEDRGWLRLADALNAVVRDIQEDDSREEIQTRLREHKTQELRKWGYAEGGTSAQLAQAEASAEAASAPDRIVPLASVACRRFRIEVLEPLLVVPKGKRKKPPANGEKAALPKGRLARAVRELLESKGGDEEEKKRLAGQLAAMLRNCGIRPEHPLRKKLDKYLPTPEPEGT